jgi:hypothetical protein
MDRKTWMQNPENYRQLAAVLETPILKQAIAIIKAEHEPESTEGNRVNATLAVSKFHESAGFYAFARELAELTLEGPPPAKKPPQPQSLISQVIEENAR